MIYLENTSEPQLLIVPNNGTIKAGYYPATLSWDVGIGSVDNAAFRISLAKRVVATLRLRELTFNWWDETGRWEIFWIPGGIPPDPLTLIDHEGEFDTVVIPGFSPDFPQPYDLGFDMWFDPKLYITLRSTIDLSRDHTQTVSDLETSSLYHRLAITLPEGLPDGEYEYTLRDSGIPLSNGLLVIGENTEPDEYQKEITYEQYETER